MQERPRTPPRRPSSVVHPKGKKTQPPKDFAYTPFYCEENIWQLCQHRNFVGKPGWVIFISNPNKKCPIWHAKAAGDSRQAVIWDYHVILLTQKPHLRVWDFDTRLGFPVSAECYFNYSFQGNAPEVLQPRFKLIEINRFVKDFASDRSHMMGKQGEWLASPPSWPKIGPGRESNLMAFADLTQDFGGRIYSLIKLRKLLKIKSEG